MYETARGAARQVWAWAVNIAAYLIYRGLSIVLEDSSVRGGVDRQGGILGSSLDFWLYCIFVSDYERKVEA